MDLLALAGKSNLGILKDPFAAKNVSDISMFYSNYFGDGWRWSGTVKFKNGNTLGEQKFKHENFDVIVKQINDFIESLGE